MTAQASAISMPSLHVTAGLPISALHWLRTDQRGDFVKALTRQVVTS